MAQIAPLKPLRYNLGPLENSGGLASVIAPPYDVIGPEERAALVAKSNINVVRLELPEGDGDAKYTHAAELLAAWRRDGVLVRDERPAFYRYAQTFTPPGGGQAITRRGFLGLVKLVPLSARIVLPHERTLAGPKEDRLKLFQATQASVSPGFMLYSDPSRTLDASLDQAAPLANFSTPDGIRHELGAIYDESAIAAIVRGVSSGSLLIADGHHRYETALHYAEQTPGAPENAERGWFMAFFANGDDPDLVVFPTHRLVHSLPAFEFDAALRKASDWFTVTMAAPGASADTLSAELASAGKQAPSLVACAGDGRAALLTLRRDVDLTTHPVLGGQVAALRTTDVALLHMGILEPILGITPAMQSAKTNIRYPQDAEQALRAVRSGDGQVLFIMNSTPVADVRRVAEAGEVMPQKSTFFYPKIPTGLCIHTLESGRSVSVFT